MESAKPQLAPEAAGDLDVLGAGFFADPHAAYRRWNRRGGVHRVRFPDGRRGWVITGYAEAREALADPRLCKSGANARWLASGPDGHPLPPGPPPNTHMLDADPPDHTRLRRLVNSAFTPRAVAAQRARIEEISTTLLDQIAAQDEVDLIESFAVPLPVTVIGEVLGVSVDDRAEFRRRCDALFSAGIGNPAGLRSLREFLAELVRAKREQPGDDLLSALVQARDDDDRLDERELGAMAFLLLFAGHETTVNLIGNGVYALLRNPDQLAAVRADPGRIPGAIEELLRFDGPVGFATLRYAGEPLTIDGKEIAAGEFVHVALNAANRDPAKFADPDRLDLARDPSGHLAFGHGIHYCVGAPLARLEAHIALSGLLQRFPTMQLAKDADTVRWREGFRIRGLVDLPVRLT